MTPQEILCEVEKDLAFYGASGGITLSGGEPFLQGEGAITLLQLCKERGISTAAETCGCFDASLLAKAVPLTDLFLWDLKDTDSARHRQYTGAPNEPILENLEAINRRGARIRLRCILVNGVNTDPSHYRRVAEIASRIENFDGAEWIPYHAYGGSKAVFLGRSDNGNREWIPSAESLLEAREMLSAYKIRVI
jgi:pyruvate formate lyase activating enzyme